MARSRLTVAAVAPVVALALAALWAGPAAAHDTTVLIKVPGPNPTRRLVPVGEGPAAQVPTGPGGPVGLSAVTSYPDGHRAAG